MSRDKNIALLTANCSCWKGKEKLLANAEQFTDQDIEALVANLQGAATAKLIRSRLGLTVNANGEPERVDDEDEEGMTDEEKQKKREAIHKLLGDHDTDTIKAAHAVSKTMDKHASSPTGNQGATKMTFTQRLEAEGTPEEKAVWNAAVSAEYEQRAGMAQRMVANVAAAEREKEFTDLMKLPPQQFRDLYTRWQRYTPTANGYGPTVAQPGQPLFVGNAGGAWLPTPREPTEDLAHYDHALVREEVRKEMAANRKSA